MISEQLLLPGLESLSPPSPISPSSPQASPVNLTLLREKVSAIVTCVTSGEKLQGLSETLNRVGSSVKIRPVYFQEKISDIFVESFPTLPKWGIASAGEFGALATSARRTDATACLSWRTPTASDGEFSRRDTAKLSLRWIHQKKKHLSEQVAFSETFLTPTATDGARTQLPNSALAKHWINQGRKTNLAEQIAFQTLFPTPTVHGNHNKKGSSKKAGNGLSTFVGGKLNPTWVAWLMGFPLSWSKLEDTETP